jgi:thiol reductant ABC exporter CydD subunit
MNLDKRLLREAQRAHLPLALTVACGWGAGVLVVGQARCLSRVVAQVFLEGRSLGDVQWLLVILIGLGLGRAAFVWGSDIAAQRVAGEVKSDLRQRLTAHLLALGPAYGRQERSGELTNTALEGVEALDAYFSGYMPQLAVAALVPLTIFFFIVPLDVVSALVLLVTAPLIPLFIVLIGSQADALTRRQWTSLSRMSAHFLDVLQGLTTLKILGRSRQQVEVIALISDRFRRTTLGVLRVAFLSALVLEMVATISVAVVAVLVGLRLLYGRLAFEQAFFVLILAPEFYLPLRLLGTRFHDGIAGVTAARRIFEILETPALPVQAVPTDRALTALSQIRFMDVRYAYDERQQPALEGVSFQISSGQKVALVGPSGAGKSTIAHLLLRFMNPDRGVITVDGSPLEELDLPAWRRLVGWVPQNPYLFHGSVGENIRLARPEASIDQVVQAARLAHAHPFIETLAQGYDTPIGERGIRISGGQAQRIALARAFLKDAPLLILDEATSNLDPEIESRLQESIARLMKDRTVLIIAHRLGTVADADHILVLTGGRVVQAGSHRSLLQREGLYRELVTAYEY